MAFDTTLLFDKVTVMSRMLDLINKPRIPLEEYTKILIENSVTDYEQIIMNLGKEYKLIIYNTILYSTNNENIEEQLLKLCDEYFIKISKLLSPPIVNTYLKHGLDYIKEDEILSKVKALEDNNVFSTFYLAINSTLELINDCISRLIKELISNRKNKEEAYELYLESLEYGFDSIIEFLHFSDVMMNNEYTVAVEMATDIGLCILSPKNDNLREYVLGVNNR